MTRHMDPAEAVTSQQFDQAHREQLDRTAPHGFDWRRAHTEAEDAAYEAQRAENQARREAEWTREVTIARRAEWNALVKSGALTNRKGQVDFAALRAQEAAQGWTADALKVAVAEHGL